MTRDWADPMPLMSATVLHIGDIMDASEPGRDSDPDDEFAFVMDFWSPPFQSTHARNDKTTCTTPDIVVQGDAKAERTSAADAAAATTRVLFGQALNKNDSRRDNKDDRKSERDTSDQGETKESRQAGHSGATTNGGESEDTRQEGRSKATTNGAETCKTSSSREEPTKRDVGSKAPPGRLARGLILEMPAATAPSSVALSRGYRRPPPGWDLPRVGARTNAPHGRDTESSDAATESSKRRRLGEPSSTGTTAACSNGQASSSQMNIHDVLARIDAARARAQQPSVTPVAVGARDHTMRNSHMGTNEHSNKGTCNVSKTRPDLSIDAESDDSASEFADKADDILRCAAPSYMRSERMRRRVMWKREQRKQYVAGSARVGGSARLAESAER